MIVWYSQIVYHGQDRWSYSLEFADLMTAPEELQAYTPHFRHLLTDLSVYTDEEVRGEAWLRVNLLVLKTSSTKTWGSGCLRFWG